MQTPTDKVPESEAHNCFVHITETMGKAEQWQRAFFAIELKCQTISSSRRHSDGQTLCFGVGFALFIIRCVYYDSWTEDSACPATMKRLSGLARCGWFLHQKKRGEICDLDLAG